MLRFTNVYYQVKDGKKNKDIIKNISFSLPNTGLVGLLGRSGSGKTTILNLISKMVKKSSGSIILDQFDYDNLDSKTEDIIRNNHISYISQEPNLFNHLTVRENILLASKISKEEDIFNLLNNYISLLNIEDLLDEYVYNLSGGEKQRVIILRSLIKGSKVFLVDEPTSSLDKENALIVVNTLKEISKKCLVIVSTHDIDIFNYLFDYTLEIEYGEIKKEIHVESNLEFIDYKPNKLSIKDDLFIESKIFKRQGVRYIFSIFIIFISMFLCLFSFIYTKFDSYKFKIDIYDKLEYKNAIVSEYEYYNILNNRLNLNDLKEFDFNINYMYYNLELFSLNSFDSSLSDNQYIFNNIVINNNLKDNEIIITDYSAETLIENKILNYNNINDLIGKEINILDNNYKIVNIENTNYNWYKSNDKEYYNEFLELWYLNLYMNENDINEINFSEYKVISYNNTNIKLYSDESDFDYTLIKGEDVLSSGEIALNPRALVSLLKVSYDPVNNNKYLGMNVTLDNKEYIIKGIIISTNDPEIFFNELDYNNIKGNKPNLKNEFIVIDISTITKSDIKYLNELGFFIITPYSNDLDLCIDDALVFKKISKYSLIICSILFISIGIYFVINNFKMNKSSISTLRTLGCSLKDIVIIFLIDILKILMGSILLSIGLYTIIFIAMNIDYQNNTCLNRWVISYDYLSILLLIIFSILIFMVVLIFNILFIKRKEIKEINNI